jgi:HEAT repeat protein
MITTDTSALLGTLTNGSDLQAEAAALRLAAGGSQNLAVIKDLLKSPHPDVRWWATRSLAEFHDPESAKLLIGSLDDADVSVRQCAAVALRQRPNSNAVPQLVKALNDPDRLMARLAADALIAIGEVAVPPMIEVMESGSSQARLEAVRALAEIGDSRAIPVLFTALDGDSAVIEHWAGVGLQKMGLNMVFFNP